ncbi:MAG: hypothetical protein LBU65_00930 [Planctomycetaceae bacterium]|jgi:hypothetical protein|nr:hypothetical protein [Planctomycetaceae bacterium]
MRLTQPKHFLLPLLLLATTITFGTPVQSAPVSLDYYLPKSAEYDKNVPTPESVLGFQVGEFGASSEQIVNYIKAVDAASDRVKLVQYGASHEKRPLYVVIISSPENQKNLDKVKAEHLKLADPAVSDSVDTKNLPVFTWLGHSIHGNEASGANAALLLIYHLAAAKDEETLKWLNESVVFVDPLINPDGYTRFISWINSNKSVVTNDDTQEREHSEPRPGGRGNHYWVDLNRDWLNVQHPESQGRIAALIEWRPNVYTDAHEQGTNAHYHFSPGIPTQIHPLIPPQAQEFIKRLARDFYAPAFDARGVLYFSGENFDDYYPGRGREYLDFHGGIAILWEQPSSRGFAQSTPNGVLTFEFAILNQLTAGLATVRGGHALRQELLDYQRSYFKLAISESADDPVKAYVFGSTTDKFASYRLAELVRRNGIDVYKINEDLTVDGKTYSPKGSYIVPLSQKQHRLIHAIFEVREKYDSRSSYDITGWTLPFAFNLDYSILNTETYKQSLLGEKFELGQFPKGQLIGGKNAYGYAFEWGEYYSPRAIYRLLDNGINVKTVESRITHDGKTFDKGAVVVLTGSMYQKKSAAEIEAVIEQIIKEDAIDVYSIKTGYTEGRTLGAGGVLSNVSEKPRIAVLDGSGAGEVWHLFDQHYGIPVSVLASDSFSRINLDKYNVLILPGGGIVTETDIAKLKTWVESGNTLIGYDSSLRTLIQAGLIDAEIGAGRGSFLGITFQTEVDLNSPLLLGYAKKNLPVFKDGGSILAKPSNRLDTPISYTNTPLLSGNVQAQMVESLAGTPVVVTKRAGRGQVIAFAFDPQFRTVWYGTNKLTANAVFWGSKLGGNRGGFGGGRPRGGDTAIPVPNAPASGANGDE